MKTHSKNNKLRIWSLASGSKANCTLICSEKAKILIDFGVSCRYAKTSLSQIGTDLSEIGAVFITHEHSDHIGGLETFFKRYDIPVHMTEPSYIAYTHGKGFYNRDKISVHEMRYSEKIGDITVTSLPVMHDSACCVAYRVDQENGQSLGICTDAGRPSEELYEFFAGCDYVITECNHDEIMLKCGIYPDELKRRILSPTGHTSNADCADFAVRLARSGVRRILLAHLSPENNTRELALCTVDEALKRSGESLDYLDVAPRYELFSAFASASASVR